MPDQPQGEPAARVEAWWCWECANLGVIPPNLETGPDEDEDCSCCGDGGHDPEDSMPPCHKWEDA